MQKALSKLRLTVATILTASGYTRFLQVGLQGLEISHFLTFPLSERAPEPMSPTTTT